MFTELKESNPQSIPKSPPLEFTTSLRRLILLSLGGIGAVLIVIGGLIEYSKIHHKASSRERYTVTQFSSASVAGEVSVKKIKIDIAGAVVRPGVYEMPNDSRVQDVLIAAGDLTAKADRSYIAKNINLAQVVEDGSKLYFPAVNETKTVNPPVNNVVKSSETNPVLININSATIEQLDTLPGIGPVTANKIIDNRPYQTISELVTKKAVGSSVYAKLKDLITAQ